jgi:hypothetical protein
MLRGIRCVLRKHDWHSRYDHERKQTVWDCRRCRAERIGDNPNQNVRTAHSGGPTYWVAAPVSGYCALGGRWAARSRVLMTRSLRFG